MLNEWIVPESIRDGDPEALATLCAIGGSAVVAYLHAAGAGDKLGDAAVAALATFRRGVAGNGQQAPDQLERLLLFATRDAVRQVAGVHVTSQQLKAADAAFAEAPVTALAPGLARDMICALIAAAPVTALAGDQAAIRKAAELRYAGEFQRRSAPVVPAAAPVVPAAAPVPAAPAAAPAPARVAAPAPTPAPVAAPVPPAPAPTPRAPAPPRAPVPAEPPPTPAAPFVGWDSPLPARAPTPAAPPPAAPPRAAAPPAPRPTPPIRPAAPAPRAPVPRPTPAAPADPDSWVPAELLGGERPVPAAPGDFTPEPDDPSIEPPPYEEPPPWPKPARRLRLPRLPQRTRRPAGAPSGRGRLWLFGALAFVALAALFVLTRSESAVKQGTIRVQALDVPFTAAGAVHDIARTRASLWAIKIRRQQPRPGRTWITLAAQSRNVSRPNFHPRALGYRLRTDSGIVIGPETAQVPPQLFNSGGRVAIGKRTSVHLGFQAPIGQDNLSLEFDPGPGSPRIRVPLN